MATSGSYNWKRNRDQIITQALRVCQVIGQGETPDSTVLSEAAETLNNLLYSWTADGMPLWSIKVSSAVTLSASTVSYTVGVSQTINQVAPMRILQAWVRDTSQSPDYDLPVTILSREEYYMLPYKETTGTTQYLYYDPARVVSGTDASGTIYVYPAPTSTVATNYRLYFVYQRPYQDFDSSTDDIDLPQEWFRAVVFGLAADLAYEYGLPFAERSMISKRAEEAKKLALENGSQEGSLFIAPEPNWDSGIHWGR